jgi:hypothetical protein
MNPLDWMENLINEVRDAGKDCPQGVVYALACYLGSLEECDEGYEDWMYAWAGEQLDGMPGEVEE